MVSYSNNIGLAKPANSSYVGTWDVPVNNNSDIIDNALGTNTTINPVSGTTTLSTAQFQSAFLTFGSTLTGNVTIVFPPAQGRGFTIQHRAANSSLYTITLQTTVAGGEVIGCKPYEPFDIICDGTNIRYRNLQSVGSYWDYAGSSVPNWVSACTVPPYLNCDGTAFSSATYPALAAMIGTTLPDSRGRYRASLNQGQSRITAGTSTGGVDGNTVFSAGGVQTNQLSSLNAPPTPYVDPGHTHTYSGVAGVLNYASGGNATALLVVGSSTTSSVLTSLTIGNGAPFNFSNLPPSYVGGLTLIRAA